MLVLPASQTVLQEFAKTQAVEVVSQTQATHAQAMLKLRHLASDLSDQKAVAVR